MSNLLLQRYLDGQHVEVWKDLTALGGGVRSSLYYQDTTEVAVETMKRARHNVESIIQKLDKLGYEFSSSADMISPMPNMQEILSMVGQAMTERLKVPGMSNSLPPDMVNMPSAQMLNVLLTKYGEAGFEPRNGHEAAMTQLAKTIEVTQQMTAQLMPKMAERLAEMEQANKSHQSKPSVENPKVFSPAGENTSRIVEEFEKEMNGPLPISLRSWYLHVGAVSLEGKHEQLNPAGAAHYPEPLIIIPFEEAADFVDDYDHYEQKDSELLLWADESDQFTMKVPDTCADATILGLEIKFVEHLRTAFAWGGFPGWARSNNRPEKELNYLRGGLLPL